VLARLRDRHVHRRLRIAIECALADVGGEPDDDPRFGIELAIAGPADRDLSPERIGILPVAPRHGAADDDDALRLARVVLRERPAAQQVDACHREVSR
jgi:hypothetical protein